MYIYRRKESRTSSVNHKTKIETLRGEDLWGKEIYGWFIGTVFKFVLVITVLSDGSFCKFSVFTALLI